MTAAPTNPAGLEEGLAEPELAGTAPSLRPRAPPPSGLLQGGGGRPAHPPAQEEVPFSAAGERRPEAAEAEGDPGGGPPGGGVPGCPIGPGPGRVCREAPPTRRPQLRPLCRDPPAAAALGGAPPAGPAGRGAPTTPAPPQVAPFTSQPYVALTLPQRPGPGESPALEEAPEAPPEEASPPSLTDKGGEDGLTGSASEESQETATSTIVTTTIIPTEQAPGEGLTGAGPGGERGLRGPRARQSGTTHGALPGA